jgi:type I restriction-modification system DNA methylase subunit
MSLFQIQVERQYLAGITTDLRPLYEKYLGYFGNPDIQANILEVIEEQYQGEFIRALFVDILGYTAQPHSNYNLIREKKNETDSKSADAAIIVNNQIIAVIELKDHKTQDLKKVETQAFGYKNNHKNCHYIVTSNFEKLRFYIENAVDFIEFDLFNLTYDDFKRLWLCLSYESIARDLPLEIKQQSLSSEDIITKQLYKDYSICKRQLFESIVSLNPGYNKLILFKKTQKLLDRFLFLYFAEDKSLIPANSVQGTVDKWKKHNTDPMNDYQSLYSRFVKYFKLLDVGYKDAAIEIYAYNGGLFAEDEILNHIRIDDTILSQNIQKLAKYDYDTDVDVNILGHIFENSLNEIEEVTNEITTGVKTTSRRKQDGVFYTPRYITQYIVENTVGRLCEEKKTELGIGEELFEYKSVPKKKLALKVFDNYREWLLHITIVDPACGSGAFLNTALDFLIAEHAWIDSQQEKITGLKGHYSMELSNIENVILENNLFGVDINDESVEIARLSLWLRTAKPHRKLSSLNNNIKCGNSLIDDTAVADEKAFDWHKEFPQVFGREQKTEEVIIIEKNETPDYLKLIKEKSLEAQVKAEQGIALSTEALLITRQLAEYVEKLEAVSAPKADYEKGLTGFDVVIGNPPYVNIVNILNQKEREFYQKHYETVKNKSDLYSIFIEKGYSILKKDGHLGFIFPNSWLGTESFSRLRKYLIEKTIVNELVKLPNDVFADAVVTPLIMTFTKTVPSKTEIIDLKEYINNEFIDLKKKLSYERIRNSATNTFSFLPEITIKPKFQTLGEIADFSLGIKTSDDRRFIFNDKINDDCFPILRGRNISRYYYTKNTEWIWYKPELINEKAGGRPRVLQNFLGEKIYIQDISKSINACFCDEIILANDTLNVIYRVNENYQLKTILVLLNSTFVNKWFESNFQEGLHIKINQLQQMPIPKIALPDQKPYIEKADLMITLNKELEEASQKFQRMLQRKFELEDLPGKLQNWYILSYKEFIAELGKKKVKLTLAQEAEWEEYFNAERDKAMQVKKQMDETDREIDRMVYELYELTEEEVGIVEGEK